MSNTTDKPAAGSEREAFHEYVRGLPLAHGLNLERGSNLVDGKRVYHEDYQSHYTTIAWRAWKARAALTTGSAA